LKRSESAKEMQHFKYKAIAVGGTFDHIHKGHRALLNRAFDTGEKVFIGITTDDFVAATGKNILHNFEFRRKQLEAYLNETFPNRDYEVTKLESSFGPGMFTSQIEAIVVSAETATNVPTANKKRRMLGLPDLSVEVVPMILAEDDDRISSTRIRAGDIDTEGKLLHGKSK
jgi:pantetheine-phosphate adenylyltransferase